MHQSNRVSQQVTQSHLPQGHLQVVSGESQLRGGSIASVTHVEHGEELAGPLVHPPRTERLPLTSSVKRRARDPGVSTRDMGAKAAQGADRQAESCLSGRHRETSRKAPGKKKWRLDAWEHARPCEGSEEWKCSLSKSHIRIGKSPSGSPC